MQTEPVFLNVFGAQESIPRNRFRQAGNRFLGSLIGLQIRAQDTENMWWDGPMVGGGVLEVKESEGDVGHVTTVDGPSSFPYMARNNSTRETAVGRGGGANSLASFTACSRRVLGWCRLSFNCCPYKCSSGPCGVKTRPGAARASLSIQYNFFNKFLYYILTAGGNLDMTMKYIRNFCLRKCAKFREIRCIEPKKSVFRPKSKNHFRGHPNCKLQ
jgi:hypothetical protein